MNSKKNCRVNGFTLIELLVVIAIIVVLAELPLVEVGLVKRQVAKAVTKARFSEYISAIELLKDDNGYYPTFGEQSSQDRDLIFPPSGSSDGDWTDFWKTICTLKSPEESGP